MSNSDVRAFLLNVLKDMNLDASEVTDATPLGEGGLELESLSTAELVMQAEEEYGSTFSDEDVEAMQGMTFGQFAVEVASRATIQASA